MSKKEKIVIIEDETELRNTLSDLMEMSGYEVLTAPNGFEGCKMILETSPDLVICDVNMPKMDGYEVLSAINELMAEELAPSFLFLTARVQLEDVKHGLQLGADDYIPKPFLTSELLQSVDLRLKKRAKLLNYSNSSTALSNGKLAIPDDKGFRYVNFDGIVKCDAERAYCSFHLLSGEKILVSKSMKEFEEVLQENGFIKVHKSHMVNIRFVKQYVKGNGGHLVMTDGSLVNVSVRKKDEVINALMM